MPCVNQSELVAHAYYLQTCKLWLNEKKHEAEISTRAFPLESPSNDSSFNQALTHMLRNVFTLSHKYQNAAHGFFTICLTATLSHTEHGFVIAETVH